MALYQSKHVRLCSYCLQQLCAFPRYLKLFDGDSMDVCDVENLQLIKDGTEELGFTPEEYVNCITYHKECYRKLESIKTAYAAMSDFCLNTFPKQDVEDLKSSNKKSYNFPRIRKILINFDQGIDNWLKDVDITSLQKSVQAMAISSDVSSSSSTSSSSSSTSSPMQIHDDLDMSTAIEKPSVESLMNSIYGMPGRLTKFIDVIDMCSQAVRISISQALKVGALSETGKYRKPSKGPVLSGPFTDLAPSANIESMVEKFKPNVERLYRELFRNLFAVMDMDRSPTIFVNFFRQLPDSYRRRVDCITEKHLAIFRSNALKPVLTRIEVMCELDSCANSVIKRINQFESDVIPMIARLSATLASVNPQYCNFFGFDFFSQLANLTKIRVDQPAREREETANDILLDDMGSDGEVFLAASDKYCENLRNGAKLEWALLNPIVTFLTKRLAYIVDSSGVKHQSISVTNGFVRLMVYLATGEDYDRARFRMGAPLNRLYDNIDLLLGCPRGSTKYEDLIEGRKLN
jgi:hypothetical protein